MDRALGPPLANWTESDGWGAEETEKAVTADALRGMRWGWLYWPGCKLYRTPKGAAGVVGHTYLKIPSAEKCFEPYNDGSCGLHLVLLCCRLIPHTSH